MITTKSAHSHAAATLMVIDHRVENAVDLLRHVAPDVRLLFVDGARDAWAAIVSHCEQFVGIDLQTHPIKGRLSCCGAHAPPTTNETDRSERAYKQGQPCRKWNGRNVAELDDITIAA